ncbi:hypothetical protein AURDEDRAFT_167759 [Auricularia subglabra TFB-10046 SS5]|nr:hypothetical protein AURDEDRAFT_167759 [Auricularia subglabra TFB-10046 SS5]
MSSTYSVDTSQSLDDRVNTHPIDAQSSGPMVLDVEYRAASSPGTEGAMELATDGLPQRMLGWVPDPVRPPSHSPDPSTLHTAWQYPLSGGLRPPVHASRLTGYQHLYADNGHEMLAARRYPAQTSYGPYGPFYRHAASRYEPTLARDAFTSALALQGHTAVGFDHPRAQLWSGPVGLPLSTESFRPPNLVRFPGFGPETPSTATSSGIHDPYLCVEPCCASALRSGLTFYRIMSSGVALRVLPHMGTRGNFISLSAARLIGAVDSADYPPWVKAPPSVFVPLGGGDWAVVVNAHVSSALPPGCDLMLGLDWLKRCKAVPDWTNRTLRFQTPFQEPVDRLLPEWV